VPARRHDALRGLGAIGDPRGSAAIEAALADLRLTVRVGSIMGCAGVCTSPATIERLADMAIHEDNAAVALAAQKTLAAIRAKGPAEDQAVRSAVDRRRPTALPPNASADQRALAAIFSADLEGPSAIPALVAVLPGASSALQRQLTWSLGGAGDARTVDALEGAPRRAGPDGAGVCLRRPREAARARRGGSGWRGRALRRSEAARPSGAARIVKRGGSAREPGSSARFSS
jgi:hypothetical protein